MLRRYLSGYKEFKCAAADCPDSCCGNWLIEIDDASLEMYKDLSKEDELFQKGISYEEKCFLVHDNGDCAFLLPNGLCHIQKNYGEEYLCRTCDGYPRHIEEFPGVREYSISVSCPVAADFLLKTKDALTWETVSDEEEDEDYDDFDHELYSLLLDSREQVINILKDKSMPLDIRFQLVLKLMDQVQKGYDSNFEFDESQDSQIDNSVDEVEDEKQRDKHRVTGWMSDFEELKNHYNFLFELDPLDDEFTEFKHRVFESVFKEGEEKYRNYIAQFEKIRDDFDEKCEQLAVYFVFTYMCGAVYDEYIFSMAKQAIYNTLMIRIMWMGQWIMDGCKKITTSSMAVILYKYSRELENCNENIMLLEELLDT